MVRRWIEIETETTPEKWAEARAIAKRNLAEMTPGEDAAITAAAMADPDAIPMTDEEFARARRISPAEFFDHLPVAVRLDRDVVDRLKATGPGWEERVNIILRKALEAA